MKNSRMYQSLNFERQIRRVPGRLVAVGLALLGFGLLWLLPDAARFWIPLALVGLLTWVASYGWRQAVHALRGLLDRLDAS